MTCTCCRFGAEGDARVQEVLDRCHRYLKREDVTRLLEQMSSKDKQIQVRDRRTATARW